MLFFFIYTGNYAGVLEYLKKLGTKYSTKGQYFLRMMNAAILWNMSNYIDKEIEANHPDVIVKEHQAKNISQSMCQI